MGQSIGWLTKRGKRWVTADVPDEFGERFDRRLGWFNAIWDASPEIKTVCGCVGETEPCKTYGCPGDNVIRPTDFPLFREVLSVTGLREPIFQRMTDWLEAHPDVWVDYG